MIDPTTIIGLTFAAHLHVPTDLCPTFALYKLGSIFRTLETGFQALVLCVPGGDLTKLILPCFTPASISALDFVNSQGPNQV